MTRCLNPYWIAYAATHGRSADEMLEADRETWPGGAMAGFLGWMSRRWEEWAKLRGVSRSASGHGDTPLNEKHHADFAGWLRGRAFRVAEQLNGPRSSRVEHPPTCAIDKSVPDRSSSSGRRFPCICTCGAFAELGL